MTGLRLSQGLAGFVLMAAFAASDAAAQTVSVDLLRHPISPKVKPLLLKAIDAIKSGDDEAAVRQLKEMLAKYPDSAPYVHDLLGVAYAKADRCETAADSFAEAALLLPHDPTTHYYFGLALLCAGDYDRATEEIQRAVKLDPKNPRMQESLNELLERKRSGD